MRQNHENVLDNVYYLLKNKLQLPSAGGTVAHPWINLSTAVWTKSGRVSRGHLVEALWIDFSRWILFKLSPCFSVHFKDGTAPGTRDKIALPKLEERDKKENEFPAGASDFCYNAVLPTAWEILEFVKTK
jgi:hypothetical protein